MSDIISQLEEIEINSENAHIAHICGKAAETIETLRAENARLREALNGLSKAFVERLIGMGCFVADIHKDKDYRAARAAMGESDE